MGTSSSKNVYRAVLLGLDAAGKTTVLCRLSGKSIAAGPTMGFNVAKVKVPTGHMLVWDVGGQERLRSFWRQYYSGTGAVVFVVDSTDVQRLSAARDELHSLLREDELAGVPVLIMANKQDMPQALPCNEVASMLDVQSLAPRLVTVLPTSAAKGDGLKECVLWLANNSIPPQLLAESAVMHKASTMVLQDGRPTQ